MSDVNRWTPGAGGGKANNCYTKLCEARGDLYPMLFFAFVITGQLLNALAAPTSCSVLIVVMAVKMALSGSVCITEAVLCVRVCVCVCVCV